MKDGSHGIFHNNDGWSGTLNYVQIANCTINGSSSSSSVGGLVGYADSAGFNGCTANNCMVGSAESSIHYVGSLAGYADLVSFALCNAENCTVQATSTSNYAGGLIGFANSAKLKECEAKEILVQFGENPSPADFGAIVGGDSFGLWDSGNSTVTKNGVYTNTATPNATKQNFSNLSIDDGKGNSSNNDFDGCDASEVQPVTPQQAQTPVPLAGILAGLGAVCVLLGRRH